MNRIPTNTNEAIVAFYNQRVNELDNQRFTLDNLKVYVTQFRFGTAPDTIARALRTLRKQGKVNYGVVNRKQGIFKALPLNGEVL